MLDLKEKLVEMLQQTARRQELRERSGREDTLELPCYRQHQKP